MDPGRHSDHCSIPVAEGQGTRHSRIAAKRKTSFLPPGDQLDAVGQPVGHRNPLGMCRAGWPVSVERVDGDDSSWRVIPPPPPVDSTSSCAASKSAGAMRRAPSMWESQAP